MKLNFAIWRMMTLSVEYRAIYGLGYEITQEEIENIPDDIRDEFYDSDFIYQLEDGGNDYFFGICLKQVDPGRMTIIPVVDQCDPEKYKRMMFEFKRFFPHREAIYLRHYLINQVW